jgi:hypothetical protein
MSGLRTTLASEINLTLSNGRLSATIKGVKFPVGEVLQEMKSGLPNRVNLIVSLDDKNSNLHRRSISYFVTYDLWDENYQIISSTHQSHNQNKIKGDSQLIEFLSNYELPNLLLVSDQKLTGTMTLTYRLIFNPVDNERVAKIKNWIQTSQGFEVQVNNDVYVGGANIPRLGVGSGTAINEGNSARTNNSLISSGPRFQKLFDKILEQNMSEDTIAAQWKSQLFVETFSLATVKNEKP